MQKTVSEKDKPKNPIKKSMKETSATKTTPQKKRSVEATKRVAKKSAKKAVYESLKPVNSSTTLAPKSSTSQAMIIDPVPNTEKAKQATVTLEKKPKPKLVQKEETIAERTLSVTIGIFVLLFVLWTISSIVFRTTAVNYSVKAQKVNWEIAALDLEIEALEASIMDLKSKQRLVAFAEEKGMEYVWERIKIIKEKPSTEENE